MMNVANNPKSIPLNTVLPAFVLSEKFEDGWSSELYTNTIILQSCEDQNEYNVFSRKGDFLDSFNHKERDFIYYYSTRVMDTAFLSKSCSNVIKG